MSNLFGNGLIGRVNVIWDSVLTESDPGIWEYVYNRRDERNYYLKDHLACPPKLQRRRRSIRLTVNESGNIISAQDYYPYGEILRSYTTGENVNDKYKYTEKERDIETGYDYFPPGRSYDSKLARWLQVDPLADKYPGWSPYNYALNNPIKFIDPNGMDVDEFGMEKQGLKAEGQRVINRHRYTKDLGQTYNEILGLSKPNIYVPKVTLFAFSFPRYNFTEGQGITGTFSVIGYTSVEKINKNWALYIYAKGLVGAQNAGDTKFFGKATLIQDLKDIETKNFIKENISSFKIKNDPYIEIGSAFFKLPLYGKIAVRLNISYSIFLPESPASSGASGERLINIYPQKGD